MIAEAIEKIVDGRNLARAEAEAAMEEILAGRATDAQIVTLLTALRDKGETVEELVGFATAMRRHARPVFAGGRRSTNDILVDTCGTGGDGAGTFNVSTAAAFVVAGAGVRVAKHGNRSISSRCGSADVLEALGVNIQLEPERMGSAIEEIGIGFLFAPAIHPAMKHAMPARRQLGGRTVFNLLGPLTNPAGATAQLLGVYDVGVIEKMAAALGQLGISRAFVVHGADGMDEISLSAATHIGEVNSAGVHRYEIAPEDFGLPRAPREALAGGDAQTNAAIIRRVLAGEPGPPRDVVVANAASALVAAGRVPTSRDRAADFREGARLASESITSGAARAKLEALAAFAKK